MSMGAHTFHVFCCPKQQTFEEAEKGFDETLAKEKGMNKDDRVHGALLILNELVRISSMEGEVRYCSCYRQQDTWFVRFCSFFRCCALLLCATFAYVCCLSFICLMFYFLVYLFILLFVLLAACLRCLFFRSFCLIFRSNMT